MIRYLLSFIAFLLVVAPAFAAPSLQTSAKQAFLMDMETGQILFQKDADERMPTSSMSKVMTTYLVFEALEQGNLSLEDRFTVSEKAWRKGGSKMFVEVDKQVKIEDLLRGVIIQSGNDATIVLAEGLAGTESDFAAAMNLKAKELGMSNSNFMNASGWPDPNHYSTARDLGILASHLIRNFPQYYGYYSEKEFTFSSIKQRNRNPLLYRNMGADGIKTGHTEVGGYGLMGSGVHNGRRVVMVINGLDSEKARAQQGAKILEYGLLSFENKKLFDAGEMVEAAEVALGKKNAVPLTVEDQVLVTLPSIAREAITVNVRYDGPLKAPVTKGDQVGTLHIRIPNMDEIVRPVIAGESVSKIGFISGVFAKMKMALKGEG